MQKRLIALAVTLSSLFLLNIFVSNAHLRTILDSVEATEQIMNDYLSKTNISSSDNVGCIRSESVGREYCGTEIDGWVMGKVKPSAQASRIELEVESFRLKKISTVFLGNEFRSALQEYSKHTEAWLEYLERMESCDDYKCFYTEYFRPNDLASTFRVAEFEFRSVIPTIDIFQANSRVEKIFED